MASITIVSGDGTRSVGTVTIAAVAPGLFVLNSAGLVAADVITVDTAGAQVFGNTSRMAIEWKYRGRIFTLADIESIRQIDRRES